jgi:hypothetical protein
VNRTATRARARLDFDHDAHVRSHTERAVRTFLDEVTNGTSDYRTIFSLTDQIRHQYLGRFAHELLQNAHDAIRWAPGWGDRRVRLEFIADDGEFGVVYAANDGQPFLEKNFNAIAKLGQSSKDPTKDIGHKGIGFRSVLQVTEAPEVYSRATADGDGFDGFCFKFDPEILPALNVALAELDASGNTLRWTHAGEDFEVPFERAEQLRAVELRTVDEARFLSAYKLPVPCRPRGEHLAALEREGFSTVVQLPLLDAGARDLAREVLSGLDGETMLFLPEIRLLEVGAGGGMKRFGRHEASAGKRVDVTISAEGQDPRKFWLWRARFSTQGAAAAELGQATAKLGDQWKELTAPTCSLAIERVKEPRAGRYYASLPTAVSTGLAAHFDGPFFASIDRKSIQWDVALNAFLRRCLHRLCLNALQDLAGRGSEEARAVIDVLSPVDSTGAFWVRTLAPEIDRDPLVLTDLGWKRLTESRLLPIVPDAAYLDASRLRRAATTAAAFPPVADALESRRTSLEALYRYFAVPPPDDDGIARVVEAAAKHLAAERDGTWLAFWKDVEKLLPQKAAILRERKVFVDEGGQLRAAGGEDEPARLFTRDAPREGEDAVPPVPAALSHLIAFLSSQVAEGGRRPLSPVLRYLQGVVADFDRRSLIQRLVSAAVGKKGADPSDHLREEIVAWAVQLVRTARKDEGLLAEMADLPLPCVGGWFPARVALVGPGWPEVPARARGLGRRLDAFLGAADTPETRACRLRLLRPPSDPVWRGLAGVIEPWLDRMQVFDGLPLHPLVGLEISAKNPGTGQAQLREYPIPAAGPFALAWNTWAVGPLCGFTPETSTHHKPYEVKGLFTLPGLDAVMRGKPELRREFAVLVAASLPRWAGSWETCTVKRNSTYPVPSLLKQQLSSLGWITVELGDAFEFLEPSKPWLVPRLTPRKRPAFEHLLPVAPELAAIIEAAAAAASLRRLGLRVYDDSGGATPPGLLQALAEAEPRVRDAQRKTWLAQIREAWSGVQPEIPGVLPTHAVVQRGDAEVIVALAGETTYVPTSSYRTAPSSLYAAAAVLHMEAPAPEGQLIQALRRAYGDRVRPLSDLELEIFSGAERWDGLTQLLIDSEHGWLVRFALAAAVHTGDRAVRTRGERFEEMRATLRATRIARVEDLRVRLAGDASEPHPQAAFWVPEKKLLLWRSKPRAPLEALAHPLQQALGRTAFQYQLRLGLKAADGVPGTPELCLEAASRELEITPTDLAEVRDRLADDLVHCRSLLTPVVSLFGDPADVKRLLDAESEAALLDVLRAIHPPVEPAALLQLVREAPNVEKLGRELHRRAGGVAELGAWNGALASVGLEPVRATDLADAWRRQFTAAQTPLRAMVAALAPDGTCYYALVDAMEAVKPTDELGLLYWSVPFRLVVERVVAPLRGRLPGAPLDDVIAATSATELAGRIELHGIPAGRDPAEAFLGPNRTHGREILFGLLDAAIAWCHRGGWDAGILLERERHEKSLADRIRDGLGPKRALADAELFSLACEVVPHEEAHGGFWQAAAAVEGVAALRARVAITDEEIEEAERAAATAAEKARRKAREVKLLGATFDGAPDALADVWSYIDEGPGKDAVSGPGVDLGSFAPLREALEPKSKSVGGSGKGSGSGKGDPKMTDDQRKVIGFAGEALAFKFLRARYGEARVPTTAWVSSAAEVVTGSPGDTDDRLGYDFYIVDEGAPEGPKEYFVEVKATLGDRCEFTLGSSQVRKAAEVAGDPGKRFVVLHITGLAMTPNPRLLPNPYELENERFYQMVGEGQRIAYLADESA